MAQSNVFGNSSGVHSNKRRTPTINGTEPPRKKVKQLLADDSSTSSDDDASGGALLHPEEVSNVLAVNQEYARRFEHNKRREELHRLEEKYGKRPAKSKPTGSASNTEDGTDSSSDSEEEDDEGILASGNLDQQFHATLTALRAKDPRVYDKRTTFFDPTEDDSEHKDNAGTIKDKPMYLSDYHRKNILEGVTGVDEGEDLPTYTQEQNNMKTAIIQEIRASASNAGPDREAGGDSEANGDGAEEDFLVPKASEGHESRRRPGVDAQKNVLDVEGAERDPEKFLSDFMSARAWVPQPGSRFQPFESDDEEEEKRADEFEEAYNLRFEDPSTTNEKLVSHARDAAARYSVRREALTGRKKAREMERAKREAEKLNREEEKARLRKLRIADAEAKINKIKDAAGLRNEHLNVDDWSKFLEEGWDDKQWDEEMRKSFGETYYADNDADGQGGEPDQQRGKIKKPKWEDDIDIKDLVPDFEEQEHASHPPFRLSDIDSDDNPTGAGSHDKHTIDQRPISKSTAKKQKLREKKEQQKQSREERRQIERLVDQNINIDSKLANMGLKHASTFRYRATSPVAYGLTAQDILLASDSQLNQYAGLKKLAAFRDSTKKAKDHKRLGKKARLRQWRKETFGNEQGPQQTLADVIAGQGMEGGKPAAESTGNVIEGSRRKKRPRH